tara:strand:+ start:101254 stop:102030 length:777 start_codon:yes stop_codon:yes gene_type:complete
MEYPYVHYSATGNTFLAFDNRQEEISLTDKITLNKIAVENNVDGLIFVEKSDVADFKFRYINLDGGEVEMCGNGLRAISQFADKELGISHQGHYKIQTMNSIYTTKPSEDLPSVLMGEFCDENKVNGKDLYKCISSYYANTGVPHIVFEVEDVEKVDLENLGIKVREDGRFMDGVNTNVFDRSENNIRVRTFERGVEGETGSCGTGITAIAHYLFRHEKLAGELAVQAKAGRLSAIKENESIWLTGPVTLVAKGSLEI